MFSGACQDFIYLLIYLLRKNTKSFTPTVGVTCQSAGFILESRDHTAQWPHTVTHGQAAHSCNTAAMSDSSPRKAFLSFSDLDHSNV